MCADIALLGSTHLVMNSKWNKQMGTEVCLCRISKVSNCSSTGLDAIVTHVGMHCTLLLAVLHLPVILIGHAIFLAAQLP